MKNPNRHENMLAHSLSFYEALFQSLDNNTVLRRKNADGIFLPVSCTREFAEMMECTPEEFIEAESQSPLCTVYPEDREEAAYLLKNGMTKAGNKHTIVRKLTMKGNIIWVDLHYAFFTSDGVEYAYCNYFDITLFKENERRIQMLYDGLNDELKRISGESLAAIRSNLSEGIVEEIDGRDLYDADRVGARMEDLIEVRLNSMPNPADRKKYLEHFKIDHIIESYEKGELLKPLVIFTKRQSGRRCFVQYTAAMRKDPVTNKTTVFGFEKEYNAEKVSEVLNQNILAKQYDMISYIVDGNYGVVIGSADSITKGSIFPKRMNGVYMDYIQEQVLPAASRDSTDLNALQKALSPETVQRELEHNSSYSVDVTCEIDHELYYKRFTFYEVDRDANFYILMKSDYTEVQREQLVRNEQLKNALEDARQANLAKTAFLSNMSHEIRTPMNAIIGLDNIALSEPGLSEKTRDHLEKIGSSARHLLGLINDILDMSRIESGRMILKNEEFSFGDMIEQINTMISSQCRERGLQYDCVFKSKVNEYYIGDDTKLKQVLINILGNAVKFTPSPGCITFTVERTAQYEDKTALRFTITDTGIGMEQEYLPKLFDAFTQENATRTSQYGGTGLGMAITKNIVEMMHGNISVQSEKGTGTVFTVNITLGNSGRLNRSQYGDVIRPNELDVLVIDDDPIACEHAKIVLAEIGVASETVQSGEEALEFIRIRNARRQPYNLILVDLHMPEQDGIEVTRKIRQIIGSEAAVIILTAYSWDDIRDDAILAGVDSFLAKPLFSSTALEEFSQAFRQKKEKISAIRQKTDLAGRHILLAEDVEINAEIMKQLLQMWEINTDVAENGKIAVDMFSSHPQNYYDAILMDVRMPVMDGLAATEAIRKLERPDSKAIPIIAMTANAFDEDVQRSLQAGMNAHLSKPVELEQLLDTLQSLIQ